MLYTEGEKIHIVLFQYFNVIYFFRSMYVNCFFMMLKYGIPCEVSFLRIYF